MFGREAVRKISDCPNCGSTNLYVNRMGVPTNHYFNYLSGLGSFLVPVNCYPTVCEDCGLTRFFTNERATAKLHKSPKWRKIQDV